MADCYIIGAMVGTGFWLLVLWVSWKVSSSNKIYDPHGKEEE